MTDDSDDAQLFAKAMSDVRPIEQDKVPPEIRFRDPTTISEREREVLVALDRLVEGKTAIDPGDTDEYHEGAVPGLDRRAIAQLKRGEFTVQADLDLHGTDASTARTLVERFIEGCHRRGLRCVRIVHGRGRGSAEGIPVLKNSLPRWLARGPARKIVLAFTSATPQDGGAGASYVLLRAQRVRSQGSDRL